ncbi:MAG: hypothetical protein WCH31_01450 [Actinomycetes bacterium]
MLLTDRRPALLLLALLAALTLAIPAARADGDPASDMLISQPLFYPVLDKHLSEADVAGLRQLLFDADQAGLTLKVAIIATRYDLGAVPSLYGKPQTYASFLGQEDFYYFKNELLVVMPGGYGLSQGGKPAPAADRAVLAALPAPGTTGGTALVAAAVRAVRALALERGIELPTATSKSSSSNRDRILIAAGVLVIAASGLGFRQLRRRSTR